MKWIFGVRIPTKIVENETKMKEIIIPKIIKFIFLPWNFQEKWCMSVNTYILFFFCIIERNRIDRDRGEIKRNMLFELIEIYMKEES